jgi:hypothetical protein
MLQRGRRLPTAKLHPGVSLDILAVVRYTRHCVHRAGVRVVASMPCYSKDNAQRGGVASSVVPSRAHRSTLATSPRAALMLDLSTTPGGAFPFPNRSASDRTKFGYLLYLDFRLYHGNNCLLETQRIGMISAVVRV